MLPAARPDATYTGCPVFPDGFDSVEISGDDPDLAALVCGQLQVLGHPVPSQLLISEIDNLVLLIMSWDPSPGFGLPADLGAALGEVAQAHLHRRVGRVRSSETPGFDGALVYLFLDGSNEEPGERAEALVQWSGQACRTSEARRRLAVARGVEAQVLRSRSRMARSEARRARRRSRPAGPARLV